MWGRRIENAKKRKRFTDEDKGLASLWVTGPVSEVAHKVELRDGKLELGPTDIYLILEEKALKRVTLKYYEVHLFNSK